MASPHERLAASLSELHRLQAGARRVFRSDEFSRVHRERLTAAGFLQPAIKGWVVSSDPDGQPGDSTPWYACLWEFCARYCDHRFGADWHLGPEQSLLLHSENTVVPAQIIVFAPGGHNNNLALPFHTSLYDIEERNPPPSTDIVVRDGLRLYAVEAALIRVPEAFFQRSPVEAGIALAAARGPAVVARLLDGGHSVVAGRLAGAFRHVGRQEVAAEIVATMTAATYKVNETNPFRNTRAFGPLARNEPPIVGRMRLMWEATRATVLEVFPAPPGLPSSPEAYLAQVDEIYVSDAYHSLSIEGYRVTPDLIERVRSGGWNPGENEADRRSRDALAARGYWQAFQKVKETVAAILAGGNAAALIERNMPSWYRELFAPSVQAGLIEARALTTRQHFVYLRTSRFVPPRWEVVEAALEGLFDLMRNEPEASVRAVLGHWLVGYIHPYPDGNGRTARFLMNAMLASGGYPWTIIRREDRSAYLEALDRASIDQNLRPFAEFVGERVRCSPPPR